MTLGLIGKKCGMTRMFTDAGEHIPCVVVLVHPHRVVSIKTHDKDGYKAVQVTAGSAKKSKMNKALIGHYAKAGVEAGEVLLEFRLNGDEGNDLTVGDVFNVDLFKIGQKVDVSGITKGKGFAGVIKRHHFSSQDASHGNSLAHRAPGSIGQRQTPGRVFKGKKMAGHLGNKKRTIKNQEVVNIDIERNLIFIKGAVPGAPGGKVIIKPNGNKVKVGEDGN